MSGTEGGDSRLSLRCHVLFSRLRGRYHQNILLMRKPMVFLSSNFKDSIL